MDTKDEKTTERMFILATKAQLVAFKEAAARHGLNLSAWVRMVLIDAAKGRNSDD